MKQNNKMNLKVTSLFYNLCNDQKLRSHFDFWMEKEADTNGYMLQSFLKIESAENDPHKNSECINKNTSIQKKSIIAFWLKDESDPNNFMNWNFL